MFDRLLGQPLRRVSRSGVVSLAVLPLVMIVALVSLSSCTITLGQPPVTNCDSPISAPVHVQTAFGGGSTLITASVMINGHGPFVLVLDTGASVSIVDETVAATAGLPTAGRPEPVSGVGGQQQGTPVQVNSWNLGQIRLPAAKIDMVNLPGDEKSEGIEGLLGSDIMRQFGVVQVDYSRQVLIVYTQIVPSPTPVHSAAANP